MAATNKPPKVLSQKSAMGKGKNASKADSGLSWDGFTIYLKGVRTEWTKVNWPTWPQIWGQTIVVLVMVTVMTLVLFALDNSFRSIIKLITPHHS